MVRFLQHTPYAAAVGTGLLLGFAFPPFPLGPLAWFALVPLLLRLSAGITWRSVVAESIAAFAIVSVLVGYWTLFHPIAAARSASAMGLLALAITSSIPFWLFGFGGGRTRLPLRFGLLFAGSSVVEMAQFHAEIGFPWLVVGHTQASVFPVNQLAAYFGVPGLSTWILISNLLVVLVVVDSSRFPRRYASVALAAFFLATLTMGYVQYGSDRQIARLHEVLAVQPALSPERWSDIRDRSRPTDLIDLTLEATDSTPELVIWPETTLPVLEARDTPSQEYLDLISFVDRVGAPLLTGAIIKTRQKETGDDTYYNSAVIVSPLVGITARYDKRILVPFAERVPYIDRFPWLSRVAVASGGVEGYTAGERGGVLKYDSTAIGIMICFESVFGRATRDAHPEEVAFYVVLAQDGWWGDTAGYKQHFALTRLRAIETGRSVVQVTVTGLTGLILPDGSSIGKIDWMERAAELMDVPAFSGSTPYARFGDTPVLVFNLLLAVCLFTSLLTYLFK